MKNTIINLCVFCVSCIFGILIYKIEELSILFIFVIIFYCGIHLMDAYSKRQFKGVFIRLAAPLGGLLVGGFVAELLSF